MGAYLHFLKKNGQNLKKNFLGLPISNKDARSFTRFFFAGAIDCELDKQGRFLISAGLREFAEFNKDIVIVGMNSRVEIWSKEKWENCNDNLSADYIAEKMEMLGI